MLQQIANRNMRLAYPLAQCSTKNAEHCEACTEMLEMARSCDAMKMAKCSTKNVERSNTQQAIRIRAPFRWGESDHRDHEVRIRYLGP